MSEYSSCSLYHNGTACGPYEEDYQIYFADELKRNESKIGNDIVTEFELIESRCNPLGGLRMICAKHKTEYGTCYNWPQSCQYPICISPSKKMVRAGPAVSRMIRKNYKFPLREC
jgi:hypothetical protein